MSAEAFAALKDDIHSHGLREPIWVKDGQIIDGRHRYRACTELAIEPTVREYSGDDIETFVISVNVARRHLSSKQKAGFIKRLQQLHPERSDRSIAAIVGCSPTTVARVRASTVGSVQTGHQTKRVGIDGREQELPTASRRAAPVHPAASLINKFDFEAKRIVKWMHDLHPHDLTDPAHFIQQLQIEVERLQLLMNSTSAANGAQ